MAGVLETAWQPRRSTQGGHAECKVAVYWRLGGIRGGTGVRTVGVRGGTGEPYSGGAAENWRYWGVPLTPPTTQGARGGIPWPR